MKISRLKTKNYSIIIGKNSLTTLNSEIRNHCPKCRKVAVIIDKKIPKKFLINIKKKLKKYKIFVFFYHLQKKLKV